MGNNGNYWSSSLNTDNPNNAWNLNFNSGNVNTNNNNRNNGQSVHPVTEFIPADCSLPFKTSPQQLLSDLYRAYRDARRHKRRKQYQLSFERHLESELVRLRDSIISGRYRPGPSTCFIIHDPKMREVFAASFRDRIVHHLLCNYIGPFLEPQFIEDSYSCIKGRGTHYGINRLEEYIRQVSHNYSRQCYVLKMDITGYFMHINRNLLLGLCVKRLAEFKDRLDWPLVVYLLERIILSDPVENCKRIGNDADWSNLPDDKSLFRSSEGCGLPIGNLTSQLFSNVYLNELDQYVTNELGQRHYGRYVDDAYVVSSDKSVLLSVALSAKLFLSRTLGLELSRNKTRIFSAYPGVEFLGAYLKPYRTYLGNECLRRMRGKLYSLGALPIRRQWNAANSYLGLTSHHSAYNIRHRWFAGPFSHLLHYGSFEKNLLRYKLLRRVADGLRGHLRAERVYF